MTLWIIFHIYPSVLHPRLLQYYISTNCTELDGSCCWRVWKRKVTNNLEKHRITHIKHRYIVLIHMQKIKRCDMLQRQQCITKHNVQYNTHTHTPANKSLPQNTPTNNTHLLFTLYCPHYLFYAVLLSFNFNAILFPYILNSFYCDCINILL